MRRIGDPVTFGRRTGTVLGYTTVMRDNEPQTFYVVELDVPSRDYLEHGDSPADCFISMMLVNADSFDAEGEEIPLDGE